jgi:hypothetical protein
VQIVLYKPVRLDYTRKNCVDLACHDARYLLAGHPSFFFLFDPPRKGTTMPGGANTNFRPMGEYFFVFFESGKTPASEHIVFPHSKKNHDNFKLHKI